MAQYLPLPDGNSLKLREGESPEQGWMRAQQQYPESFGGAKKEGVKRDTTGFKAAAAAGLERLGGEFELLKGKVGLKDQAEAQREYEAAQKRAAERFTPTEKGWTEDPLLKFRETLGGSVPYMAVPAAAGLAALAAPVSAPVAAALGAGAAGVASAGQFTGSNLARQMEQGKTLEEASLGKAFAAAVPQAAIDTAAMALLPGVGRLFGSVGSKLTTEQAKAIASQTLGRTVADYAAKTGAAMTREGLTEATQQALERVQAGLNIADPEARKEYIESFVGGAVLGGTLAPIGRFTERGAAKEQAAKAEADEKAAVRKAQLLQQEQQRQEEEAAKNTPDYALKVADDYAAAQKQHDNLKASIRKSAKGQELSGEDKAFNREVNQQLKELTPTLNELSAEKNRITQSGLLAQALEQRRRAALTPEDFLLEQAGEVPTYKPGQFGEVPAVDLEGIPLSASDVAAQEQAQKEAEQKRQLEKPAAYAAERLQLAQDQLINPTGAEMVDYLLQDPYMATLVVETKTPMPGMTASESSMIRNAVARQLKAMSKEELAQRQEQLKAQVPGKEQGNPLAQFLADQDMLDVARQEGMTESEIKQIEQLARMPTAVVDQGELFPSEQRVGQAAGVPLSTQMSDKLGELQRQLDVAKSQRNTERGGQYLETIRGIREQIADILSRAPLQTIGGLGQQTAELQGLLGQAPESLRQQQEAQAAREQLLGKLAAGEDTRFDVLDGLVNEIKAVRGDLKPETITEIEREAAPLLDVVSKYGEGYAPDVAAELGAIAQKWRAGAERGQTFTRTATPTQTSEDMLREQMDRTFAQNDMSTRTERRERYAPEAMALLNQIADNFKAFAANPERRNLAGEWLNRLTTTGVASPEMSADLRRELEVLEQGKRSETETPTRQTAFGLATKPTQTAQQLELPERMMPKEVSGEAPAKKAEAFATAAEFQKYLASDALKQLRREAGLTKDTASRLHQRMETFRKKYENIMAAAQKQIDELTKRQAELERMGDQERRAAKTIVADAQTRLDNIYARLDEELRDLQIEYMQARDRFEFSAQVVDDIGAKVAANVETFMAADAPAVETAQATAAAKSELARIKQLPVTKKNFSAMRAARQSVIDALKAQRLAMRGADARFTNFLDADLNLQMQLQEAEKQLEGDARTLLEAGLALEEAAAKQKRSRKNKAEIDAAQKELATALELSTTELRKTTGSIGAELRKVDAALATATATQRAAEAKLAPKEAPKSAFEQKLAEVKVEPLTRAERDAIAARDKAELENFQATAARLAAIPGTKIDFSKRQEMLEVLRVGVDQQAELEQKIKDVDTGVEEMQIAAAIAEEAVADTEAGYSPEQKAKFQERIKQANERVAQLQAYGKRLESQLTKLQQAYAKATLATSSDPEIYKQVTKDIDARIEKLKKNIAENTERLQKREAKSGEKAAGKTLRQARKRMVQYKRELKRLEELRSNRLGVQRFNAVTGEKVSDKILVKQGKTVPQKPADLATQEAVDAEKERAEQYKERYGRLIELQRAQEKLEAAAQPKTKAKQDERAEKLRKLQEDINKQIDLVNEVRPKGMGKVSAAARIQTSAPGKFRAGTAETKATTGVTRQPIVEKRAVAQPTATKAVEEANAFAERLAKARTDQQREELILAKTLDERQQIIDAVNDNVLRMRNRITALEEERKTLVGAKSIAANDRLAQINKELDGTPVDITDVETTGLRTMLKKAEAQLTQVAAEITKANEVEADRAFEMLGTDMGAVDPYEDYEFSRGTPVKGGQTTAALEKALDKVVGDPGIAGRRIKILQSVDDLFADPRYRDDYEGANIPPDAKAFVNPDNGDVFMFADNIGKGEALGVLLHEIGVHIGFRNLFNKAQYARLVTAVKTWANRNDGSLESQIAQRAIARVEAAETTAAQYDDELLAYAVEEAVKAGVNPNALKNGGPIQGWLKVVLDVLRNALTKFGINPKTLTTGDLVNMAYGAAQLELRGTWHGSDAVFTAFDDRFFGAGEGAYEQRFAGSSNLGRGPYVTPNKAYAEYYQHAVPFGKAANATGYGNKTYQDYRAMDEKFLFTKNDELTTAALQSKFESRLLTAYLQGVSSGQSLDPAQNKRALAMLNRLQTLARNEKERKAAATLDLQKIQPLAERPAQGNLYRTLDDIPPERVFGINEKHTLGERPKLDALMRKYAFNSTIKMADRIGWWAGNGLFFNMRDKLGIDKTIALLKEAGIDAIEQTNEGKYVERAYIDQAPEILGMNLTPVGPAKGEGRPGAGRLLFSRSKETNALTELAGKVVAPEKSFMEQLKDTKALELEMSGVDARAALEKLLKNYAESTGEANDYTQAMYLIRKSDDMLSQARVNMESGSLELFRDSKGLLGVRSSGKNSAAPVFEAVGKIPSRYAPTAEDKYALATTYAAAKRAANKGLQKLDTGALGLDEAELKAALAAANADPELRDALENFSVQYNAYNQGLIGFLAESGAISQKLAKELLANGDYVPFYRVRADGTADLVFSDKMVFSVGDIRRQPYLAELKGDDTKIMPLNESLPRNTMLLVDKALTNLAQRNLAYAMQEIGRGKGPIDPRTGKPKNLMVIHKETEKSSPDDARVIRFNQEPDPRDPKDDGRRWVMVEANGTEIEGVPAELVVKSLEGTNIMLPGFLKLAGAASDLLRTGVTRTPMYIARQLYKEPMAAAFTGGLNYTPFRAVLEAGKEYVRMVRGNSEAQAALIEKGLVQSQIFSGSPNDIKKVALQLAKGGDQSVINKLFAALDRAAINADAATRALVYKNALANGMSEVEAEHMARESMNFSKRGSNAGVQYASRLIPFMNAQIQGLNVLYKAMTGQMPYNEQLRIKRKFYNNAMLLFATGLVYAMAMEDDEYYKNARPRDRYTNFFLHLPGVEEPLKIATPFEAGYFFSLAVAAVDGMKKETNTAEQFRALRDMFLSSIPGYSSAGMPQIIKPALEVWTNKNFLTGAPIESLRMQNLETADRYNASTTEMAKMMSRALPLLSPIQIEHIVRGYLGIAPIAAAAMINGAVPSPERGERPTAKASETPFFGSAFQRKMGGAQADEVYRLAEESFQARTTYNTRLKEGRAEEAKEFRDDRKVELAMAAQAGQYRQLVGRLNSDIRRTQNRTDLTGDEKRERIDRLEQAKLDAANRFLESYRKAEDRLGG